MNQEIATHIRNLHSSDADTRDQACSALVAIGDAIERTAAVFRNDNSP